MIHDIEKIIKDGIMAPSGENCQPWRFVVEGDSLDIFNVPEADMSLYNSLQKGSYFAHGALIENIVLSAQKHGYSTHVSLFPDKYNENQTARIVFEKAESVEDSLYPCIVKRCTNRKDFSGEKLTSLEIEQLQESILLAGSETLVCVDETETLKAVGQALAVNERVLFENKKIHDFFYGHIIWDKKDENKAGGFFIDTLEFLPHQLGAVKLFKHWTILKLLNRIIGVSKMISKENGEKYAQSGTLGALLMKGETKQDFVSLGRSMQRVWLTATKLGLAVHPCNGTIYFMEHIKDGGVHSFSKKHRTLIEKSYEVLQNAFGAHGTRLGFIFRIGKADAPTARAMRCSPTIDYVR